MNGRKKKNKIGKSIFKTESKSNSIKDDYIIGEELGSGTFSIVKKGVEKSTGRLVAIKIIDKQNVEVNTKSLKTEVDILKKVKNPNIVELIDIYESDKKVYLVMELLTGGEMFDRITNEYPNGYTESTASILTKKIVSSLKYLHSQEIVHRDLKPENLIYTSKTDDSDIKITDFGLAKIASNEALLKTACGTPNYVAPEVLMNEGYDAAVDMWSVGVIIYILLCGFPPFYSENTPELFDQIIHAKYSFPSPYWDNVSASAKDLITNLLQLDKKKRFTPQRTLQHPWVKIQTLDNCSGPSAINQARKCSTQKKNLILL